MWLDKKVTTVEPAYAAFKPCPFCGDAPAFAVTFSVWYNKEENITEDFESRCGEDPVPEDPAGYLIHVGCIGDGIFKQFLYGVPEGTTREQLRDPLFYVKDLEVPLIHWNRRSSYGRK